MKPLKRKLYGTIPHLPSSRLGPSDKQANPGHVRIATETRRDLHDLIIIQEKIDGSNVGVAKLTDGSMVALVRAGYEATTSPYEQHHYWAVWVWENGDRFDSLLMPGEWCAGEWCIQAHSTRYVFDSEPFFLFDIFRDGKKITYEELCVRNKVLTKPFAQPIAYALADGGPISLETARRWLEEEPYGAHGAIDFIEGFVWRVERKQQLDFMVKYVRPDKQDGILLPELTGHPAVFNYWHDSAECIKHLRNEELLRDRRSSSQHTEENPTKSSRRCIRKTRSNS